MSTLEHLKIDFLFLLGVGVTFGVFFYYRQFISDIHALFLFLGTILFGLAFVVTKVGVGLPKVSNLLFATGVGNLVMGLPTLGKTPETFVHVALPQLTVGVFAEEIFRLGVAVWVFETFKSQGSAIVLSAIAFAAMHVYWQPAQWLTAIIAGALLSLLFVMYGSATACVVTHTLFDFYGMGYMSPILYFGSSIIMSIVGYIAMKKFGGS